ncbi:MAG: HEAT repeat domain-containing protein [Anaerolineales bacterium]
MAKQIPFEIALNALCDESSGFSTRYLNHFSDLSPANLAALMQRWPEISKRRKHSLLKHLVERYAEDNLLSFDVLAAALLNDPDGEIRQQALRLLIETSDPRLIAPLLAISQNDPQEDARQAAIRLLGNFVEMSELEELPAEKGQQLVTALLRLSEDASPAIQRAALEALGYAADEKITALIEAALTRRDPQWQTSALIAIAHSADPAWQDEVIPHLNALNPALRRAAASAAGELHLSAARPLLLEQLEEEEDNEVFLAILWALSLIGGEDVRETLQTILDDAEEEEDEALAEYVEDALLNLDFTEDAAGLDLLALDPDDEDDLTNHRAARRK